jgi:putative endonuclease
VFPIHYKVSNSNLNSQKIANLLLYFEILATFAPCKKLTLIHLHMARHNQIGIWGENLACEKLVSEGCAIVARNWRIGHYEVDIIAMKGSRIIFAEVKTRTDAESDPLEALTRQKMMRIVRSANAYIHMYDIRHEPQFDIFAITGTPDNYKLEHIPDAFFPNQCSYK